MISWLTCEAFGWFSAASLLHGLSGMDAATAAIWIFTLLVADVLIPVPSTPLMLSAGALLGVPGGVLLTVAASMGSSVLAYGIGRFAAPRIVGRRISEEDLGEMHEWGVRFGPATFALARGLPMMAETAGIAAGVGRVPIGLFLRWTLYGTVPICAAYVVAGRYAETVEQGLAVVVLGFAAAVAARHALRRRMRDRAGTAAARAGGSAPDR